VKTFKETWLLGISNVFLQIFDYNVPIMLHDDKGKTFFNKHLKKCVKQI